DVDRRSAYAEVSGVAPRSWYRGRGARALRRRYDGTPDDGDVHDRALAARRAVRRREAGRPDHEIRTGTHRRSRLAADDRPGGHAFPFRGANAAPVIASY